MGRIRITITDISPRALSVSGLDKANIVQMKKIDVSKHATIPPLGPCLCLI